MSNNKEKRYFAEHVHLFIAIYRNGTAKDKKCIRQVIGEDEDLSLRLLEAKCRVMGDEWRIHKTVNARDCEKARKWLIKRLIDFPEKASHIDTEWRTALMQRECVVKPKRFMLDIDTQDQTKLNKVEEIILLETNDETSVLYKFKTPKGFHYITIPFDTREVCELPYVTLLRDGYYYIKTIK